MFLLISPPSTRIVQDVLVPICWVSTKFYRNTFRGISVSSTVSGIFSIPDVKLGEEPECTGTDWPWWLTQPPFSSNPPSSKGCSCEECSRKHRHLRCYWVLVLGEPYLIWQSFFFFFWAKDLGFMSCKGDILWWRSESLHNISKVWAIHADFKLQKFPLSCFALFLSSLEADGTMLNLATIFHHKQHSE